MKDEICSKTYNFNLSNLLWYSFLFLIFSLSLMQPFFYYKNLRFSLIDFIFPIVFALSAFNFITKRIIFRWHKFYWFLLFYFLSMLVSAFFSIDIRESFIKLSGEFYLLSLAIITFNFVRTREQLAIIIKSWLAGTTVSVLIGLVTIFLFYFQKDNSLLNYTTSIYGAVPVGNYPRLTSTFISASMFCNYLNVSVLLVFAADKLELFSSWLSRTLLISLTICAVFTISSGLGGVVLAFSFWAWLIYRQKNFFLAKFAMITGVFIAIALFFMNFVALQKHPTSPFTLKIFGLEFHPSSRLLVWIDSGETFFENFLSGRGLGQDACRVTFQNAEGTPAVLTDAHNIFLSVAAQNGIFGLIAVFLVMLYLLKLNFFRVNGNSASSVIFYFLGAAFVCSFCYQGLTGSFEDARHLWVLIGLLLSAKTIM